MSCQTAASSRLERVQELSVEDFVFEYLAKNRPVVVRDAMRQWRALETWKPESLVSRFGKEKIQVYGDLFRLAAISSLAEYLERYFGRESTKSESVPVEEIFSLGEIGPAMVKSSASGSVS